MKNFNTAPYYDDFDPNKNYHRILFKPGYAVQSRELTQSQTILQDQISKFADNIFSQNTPVTGGKVTTNLNCNFIKLNSTYGSTTVSATAFLNKIIKDQTGTVIAKVIAATEATGTVSTAGDPPTLIVSYISGSQFTDGMLLSTSDGSNLFATVATSTTGNPSTGSSSTASISDGVFYIVNGYSQSSTQNPDGTYSKYSIGNFVTVNPQTIILDKYDNTPSFRIGLEITETIVDYINDSSLLDPAVGASNYEAPGADRYQITLTLTTLPLTLGNDDAFIELVRVSNGKIVKQVDGTVYSVIDDYFAKRDYETNGDYIVNDFKLTPSANTADSTKYDLKVGKGIAYVRGYRIENQSDYVITSDRARTTETIGTNAVYMDYGSYFVVDSANGVFNTTNMQTVDVHCVPYASVNTATTTAYNSTLVGSGYIRNLKYVSNTTDANTQSYVYEAFVNSLTTNVLQGSVSSATATTITISDTTGAFSTTANAYYGVTVSIASGTDAGDTRKIVSYNGTTKTFTVDSPFTVTPDATSVFKLLFSTTSVESILGKSGTAITSHANINNSGKVSGIPTGDTIFENTNSPELVFQIGNPYVSSLANSSYTSAKLFTSQTFQSLGNGTYQMALTLTSPYNFEGTGTLSADAVKQNFIVIDATTGNYLDFSTAGNTVSISADHFTATFSTTTYTSANVDVIATVFVSNGQDSKVLKAKNLITGNTSVFSNTGPSGIIASNTFVDLTNGQVYIKNAVAVSSDISLYVTDIKKVKKIIDTKGQTPSTSMLTSATYDVTNLYQLDNGQRDSYYDFGIIKRIPGAPLPTGDLLVIFDYYQHASGDGYFSVLSYLSPLSTSPENYAEIPSYTSKHGTTYSLGDCLDFRPSRVNATSTFSIEIATPGASAGMLIPQNLSQYVSQYSYYLGRKDKLVLSKDKSFQIITGTPSTAPIFPTEPNGSLVLAHLSLDPYTAYVPGEVPVGMTPNLSINKIPHYRWIKSDITNLQTRVNNLEYYTSLSLLEQNAQALQVPDVNGLNRYKNGILVDDFSTYSTADTSNQDFAANINIRKKQLTPVSIVENFQLQNPIALTSLGTLSNTNTYAVSSINGTHTNIFTLPYTLANVVVQPLASSDVSLNPFAVTVYEGVAQLNPPMDNWVDNKQAPSILITDPSMQVYQQTGGINVTNIGDFQTIPGTSVSTSTSTATSVLNHGRFDGPFGSTVGYTATTTQTYTSSVQQGNVTSTAGYSAVSSLSTNNGYITNIAILPYIRPQQIIVKAKGLLVNANVSTWFDGQNVDQYMHSPDTIELTGVTGTFKENDVIGYMSVGTFYPTARVISVYNYGNGNVRLYVARVTGTPQYTTSTTIQNAFYDANGNYASTTASGTINSTIGITNLNASGQVTGVGGSYSNGTLSSLQIYKVQYPSGWSSFMNQYAVWSDLNRSTGPWSASFSMTAPVSGTYNFYGSADNSATFTVEDTVANSQVLIFSSSSYTTTSTAAVSLIAGRTYTVSWTATNDTPSTPAGVALVAKDPNGNIVFASSNPPNLTYTNVASEITMPNGGAYFTGVSSVRLDQNASNIPNYYVGATINITSKIAYDLTTQTATYVPPATNKNSGGAGGGGGGCCVVATELTNSGAWSYDQLVSLNKWAIKVLDKNWLGEKLHRGYHIIAPKFIIPNMKKSKAFRKYAEWSFTNATNMLSGKKFNVLSVPNSIMWFTLMTATGFFVSKEKAEKSWKSLY